MGLHYEMGVCKALETGEFLQINQETDWDDDKPKEEEEEWEEEEEEEEQTMQRTQASQEAPQMTQALLAEGSPQREFVGVMVDWHKTLQIKGVVPQENLDAMP